MKTRSLLHIASRYMLEFKTVSYWVERFVEETGTRPTEIVLPAIDVSGATYESRIDTRQVRVSAGNTLLDWMRQSHELLGQESPIWAHVLSPLPFIDSDTVLIRDQYGSTLEQHVCIVNPIVQKVIEILVDELCTMGLYGVAFDFADIYPNSGAATGRWIQNTCFCNYCLSAMEDAGWKYRQRPFLTESNISRLILNLTETGTAHIDPSTRIINDNDVDLLISSAKARGYVDESEELLDEAGRLIQYLKSRRQVTGTFSKRIADVARSRSIQVAIILGGEDFDLAQGSDLHGFVSAGAADEYWLPDVNLEYARSTPAKFVQYLHTRGTYFIDYLFDSVNDIKNWSGAGSIDPYVSRLNRSARIMRSGILLNPGNALLTSLSDGYSGFAGVPIGSDDIRDIVGSLNLPTEG